MPSDAINNKLEAARTRLEASLSRLSHGVVNSKEALSTAQNMIAEKSALADKVAILESENLKLHDQIAVLSNEQHKMTDVDELRNEKDAIDQNYQRLKLQFASLQDELEAVENNGMDAAFSALKAESEILQQENAILKAERDTVKVRLDGAISHVETMMEA